MFAIAIVYLSRLRRHLIGASASASVSGPWPASWTNGCGCVRHGYEHIAFPHFSNASPCYLCGMRLHCDAQHISKSPVLHMKHSFSFWACLLPLCVHLEICCRFPLSHDPSLHFQCLPLLAVNFRCGSALTSATAGSLFIPLYLWPSGNDGGTAG